MGRCAGARGVSRDLHVVKAKIFEGLVAKLLTIGIVRIVVVLISKSSGVFCKIANARGRPWPWAVLGHRNACTATPCWAVKQEGVATGPFLFLMHFLI